MKIGTGRAVLCCSKARLKRVWTFSGKLAACGVSEAAGGLPRG